MITIDARGETCPMPVIMLKKALKNDKNDSIRQIVDNELAKENVEKMLMELGVTYSSKKKDNDYIIDIGNTESVIKQPVDAEKADDIIVLSSNKMGEGNDELGEVLMANFIYTLTESDVLPSKIIMYNSGVKLACEKKEVVSDLKKLADMGIDIMVCGLCLNYYGLEKKLQVGNVSNMYAILQAKQQAMKIIKP
jgi:selenium metabolism protein YedF